MNGGRRDEDGAHEERPPGRGLPRLRARPGRPVGQGHRPVRAEAAPGPDPDVEPPDLDLRRRPARLGEVPPSHDLAVPPRGGRRDLDDRPPDRAVPAAAPDGAGPPGALGPGRGPGARDRGPRRAPGPGDRARHGRRAVEGRDRARRAHAGTAARAGRTARPAPRGGPGRPLRLPQEHDRPLRLGLPRRLAVGQRGHVPPGRGPAEEGRDLEGSRARRARPLLERARHARTARAEPDHVPGLRGRPRPAGRPRDVPGPALTPGTRRADGPDLLRLADPVLPLDARRAAGRGTGAGPRGALRSGLRGRSGMAGALARGSVKLARSSHDTSVVDPRSFSLDFDERGHVWTRTGTTDRAIVRSLLREYRALEPYLEGADVLDVGGHVGGFARFALDRGAASVTSFEPDEANADLFVRNVPDARLVRSAVTRDGRAVNLYSTGDPASHSVYPTRRRDDLGAVG